METQNIDGQVVSKPTLINPTDLISNAWKFYKKNFKRLWPLFLLGSIGNTGLSFNTSNNVSSVVRVLHISLSAWIALIVAAFIVFIFVFISKIALFKSISDVNRGVFVGIKDSYKKCFRLFWPLILLSIMSSLAILGASALLLVPGIILYGYILFSQIVFFDQDKRNFQAMLGSWSLIRGYWWSVFWRILVSGMLIGVLAFLGVIVVGIPLALLTVFAAISHSTVFLVIIVSIGAICMIGLVFLLLQPLAILVLFEIYYNIRSIRAGESIADENLDRRRKRKIIACMLLGVLAFLAIGFASFFLAREVAKIQQKSSAGSALIPHKDFFTLESASDEFTIDYPVSWNKSGETVVSKNGYAHTIHFTPKSYSDSSSTPDSSITVMASSLPKGVKDLAGLKNFFLYLLAHSPNVETSFMNIATSTVGNFPSLEITFTEKDTLPATATSSASVSQYKVMVEAFIIGDYYYGLSFYSRPETYSHDLLVAKGMIDSWYLYYTQKKVGNSLLYENRDYAYSLEYPKDWIQAGASPEKGVISEFMSPNFVDGNLVLNKAVGVWVEYYAGDLDSYKDRIVTKDYYSEKYLQGYKVDVISSTHIDGASAYRIVYSPETDAAKRDIAIDAFVKGGKAYQLIFVGLGADDPLIKGTEASFKFIDPVPGSTEGLVRYDDRQYGYAISVPGDWLRESSGDLSGLSVDGYMISSGMDDPYAGILSIGIPDDYYRNRQYSVEQYRDDAEKSWEVGNAYVHDFKLLETGTTTIAGLPAAYLIGTYPAASSKDGRLPPILEVKQIFVDRDGVIRWFTYDDDKRDYNRYEATVDQVIDSLVFR